MFEPAVQPTAVGPAQNNLVTIPIPSAYRDGRRISRVEVIPKSGSATTATAKLTSDSAGTTRRKQIAAWSGVTAALPVDDTGDGGRGFSWEPRDDATNVYVIITPDAGNDNAYDIRIYIDEVV